MEGAGRESPIIRSSWKRKPTDVQSTDVVPVELESPTSSFLSANTVSPLTGFCASATATDVSWTTAFQTPEKPNTSKTENTSTDVFMTTCAEQSICLPPEIAVDEPSKAADSENEVSSVADESHFEGSPAKPKTLSTSEVLSTFRNNTLQRIYPKPPSPKEFTKSAALFSTPKADRPMPKMPQPPASAILPSSRHQTPAGLAMRLKVCPCGTCSCPAVYLRDVGVQTTESGTEEDGQDDYEIGGLTQLAAQEIGRYDGLTQRSINQEMSKIRPKSVVHFHEPLNDRTSDDDEKPASKTFASFSNAGSGDAFPMKIFDARKFFGDDLVIPDEKGQAKQSTSDNSLTNNGFQSFKKASGATCAASKSAVDAKKFFGDNFADLKLPPQETKSLEHIEGGPRPVSAGKFPQKSSLKKPTSSATRNSLGPISTLNSSITEDNLDAKKLFGDDFPTDFPQNQLGGFKLAREKHTNSACSKPIDNVAKARSVFGEEIDSLLAERSSGYVGFQFAKKLASAPPENTKTATTCNESNYISCSALPEGSDVESVYDEDMDSNGDAQNIVVDEPDEPDEPAMEEGDGETFSIPPELFLQASDQVLNTSDRQMMEARAEQKRIIAEKSSTSSSPRKTRSHGIMWRSRFASEQSLRSVSQFTPNFSGSAQLDPAILQVVTNPYSCFRFPAQVDGELVLQSQTVDGGLLVAAPDGTVGCEELKTCLLTTPGVDPRLIPDGWVENHYRWIIWKLAKEVFAFRTEFPDPCSRLSAECVTQQLKYRYDREIDLCKRPCLRRIVEKDSSSKGMMALCVSKIVQNQQSDQQHAVSAEEDQQSRDSFTSVHPSSVQIELTDGWYSISTQLDAPLQRMATAGRIFVGCKLVIAGAELNGLSEGVDPLHIPSSCHLRISANSTRLVKRWWSSKMGFVVNKKLCVPIRSLFPGGGNANTIKVVVGRVYPLLYVEKRVSNIGTTDNIYRLETDEAAEAERAKAAQERKLEEIMSKMADSQSPRPGAKRRKITSAELKELSTGDEIATALRESFDPESVEQMLSEEQRDELRRYMASRNDKMAQKIQAALQKTKEEESGVIRNVTPVLKLFVIGMSPLDRQTDTNAVLSIWRPPEGARELLQEGGVYFFHNVSVSRPPSSFNCALLNGTQLTTWQPVAGANSDDIFIERNDTTLHEITTILENPKTANFTNREVDIVGIVLRPVTEQTSGRRLFFVDTEGDIGVLQGVSISFSSFLLGDCARQTVPGTFVATNLRLNTSGQTSLANQGGFISTAIPTLFAQDYSNFFYLSATTTTIPPRILSTCRHLEAAIKTALVNRVSLAENGFRKLETTVKLSSLPDETSRSVSRTDVRNVSLNAETGPQRPGSSTAKTPGSANQSLTGHELQKRKMEKLDRIVALGDSSLLSAPSPLPTTSKSAQSRSILKRAFRTPFKSDSNDAPAK